MIASENLIGGRGGRRVQPFRRKDGDIKERKERITAILRARAIDAANLFLSLSLPSASIRGVVLNIPIIAPANCGGRSYLLPAQTSPRDQTTA